MSLADIPAALRALQAGRPVIVADDEARENEGDVVMAAQYASQEWIAWAVRHSSGYLCAPMTNEIADRLELPLMVAESQDWRGTAYTVSVDAADRLSTGISASDRAHTLRALADPASTPASQGAASVRGSGRVSKPTWRSTIGSQGLSQSSAGMDTKTGPRGSCMAM